MRVLPCLVLLLVLGCVDRPPPNDAQVSAAAAAMVRQHGLVWGPVTAVWPPGEADAEGRRWWQVDFREALGERRPVVLVDADSAWVRFPDPGERVRVGLSPLRSRVVDRPAEPAGPDGSTWILVVREYARDQTRVAGAEAERLNAFAADSALRPLFSVRSTTVGGIQLVYGWDGERGIRRDEAVADYLERWDEPPPLRWIDLSAAP